MKFIDQNEEGNLSESLYFDSIELNSTQIDYGNKRLDSATFCSQQDYPLQT